MDHQINLGTGFQVCDLLDLLGESEAPLQESDANVNATHTSTSSSASGNLLDLLGGLESTPGTFLLLVLFPGFTFTFTNVEQSTFQGQKHATYKKY